MYEIEFMKRAVKELRAIPNNSANDIMKKIRALAENPYRQDLDIKKLKGLEKVHRLRVGDYRVIYEINNKRLIITIIKVGSRGGIYD